MKFTFELANAFAPNFRLQIDQSWRDCSRDHTTLKSSDFTANNPASITELSSLKGALQIGGKNYQIDPTSFSMNNVGSVLSQSSSIFRNVFPEDPAIEQLIQVIEQGDDRHHNCLILNYKGLFELRASPPFNQLINDPSIILRHETFIRGNEYVGREASKNVKFINDHYEISLEYWKNHLLNHSTHEYSDSPSTQTLEDIKSELNKMRKSWKPDY